MGHSRCFIPDDQSFDGVAQCCSVIANTHVAGDDCHERGRIAPLLNGGQMNGVQCADRFDGKWAPGMGEDCFGDAHDIAAPGETPQGE